VEEEIDIGFRQEDTKILIGDIRNEIDLISQNQEMEESEKNKLIKYAVTPLFVSTEIKSNDKPNYIKLFCKEKKFPLLK